MPWAFHSSFEPAPVLNRSLMRDIFHRHLTPSNSTFTEPQSIRDGISIVACCMNRHHTLEHVLSRWREVRHVSQIVIVDWSSHPPLLDSVRDHMQQDPRIRLLRVESENNWVLSRAYNLAMRAASYRTLLRTDCDYAIGKDFVDAHPINGSVFYAGNYAAARDENEIHLNGAVYINRDDVLGIGGYDERIQTYGWDDEDLYSRLSDAGYRKLNISYDHISHVAHPDKERAQKDVRFVQVEIDLNSLLLKQLPKWNSTALDHFKHQWAVTSSPSDQYTVLHAVSRPRPLKDLVSSERMDDAWNTALGQRLANDYNIPWDIMVTMSPSEKRLLLTKLNARMLHRDSSRPARVLFAHVMHGLGNRLRALGSAMSFANATDRELVLIWETDAHIAASFSDLFEHDDIVVMTRFQPKWPFKGYEDYDKSWRMLDKYNYMEMEGNGAVKGQFIVDRPEQHMYFKSAYIMEADSRLTDWNKDNDMLRSLRPVKEVRDLVEQFESRGLDSMVGIHIRDRTLDRDIKDVKFDAEYGSAASKEMEHWRRLFHAVLCGDGYGAGAGYAAKGVWVQGGVDAARLRRTGRAVREVCAGGHAVSGEGAGAGGLQLELVHGGGVEVGGEEGAAGGRGLCQGMMWMRAEFLFFRF
ncbi:Glycosyltransferase 2 [Gracilaria domingensis]|nr:Glycosyltransferase 2 [Gracilaria domingensis]